jgi:hypothetical protein
MKIDYDLLTLPTGCSGGVISGNFFLMADSDLDFEIAHADVIEAELIYEKWKNFPINKKERFEVLYKACERLLKSLHKVRKVKGSDEAVFLLRRHYRFARNPYFILGEVYYTNRKLAQTTRFKDLRRELFRWGDDYPGYDFFTCLRV